MAGFGVRFRRALQRQTAQVDPQTCQPQGGGASRLCTSWADPDYDPEELAFYYVRAIQNPSCRWSQHICIANAVDCTTRKRLPSELEGCCDERHQPIIQERAWSSPIWIQP